MPFDENGFLGKEALEVSERIREKHKDFLGFCREVNVFAHKLIHDLHVTNDNHRAPLAASFFLRVLESAQATIILVERGFNHEAATLLRSVYESLVYLKLCVDDENFVQDYKEYGLAKAYDDLTNIVKYETYKGNEDLMSFEDLQMKISEVEGKISKVRRNSLKNRFKKRQLAKDADMEGYYITFYSVVSSSAHTGLPALRKHLKINDEGKVVDIIFGCSDEHARHYLHTTADFMVRASSYICNLFNIDKDDDINHFNDRIKDFQDCPR